MKVITIGRKEGNNIVINDMRVSRNHLQIILDDDGNYYAIDLGSTNGTYVNGRRINNKVLLQRGDIVVIGTTTLKWEQFFTKSTDSVKIKNQHGFVIIIVALLLISIIVAIILGHKREQQRREEYEEVSDSITTVINEHRIDLAEQSSMKSQKEKEAALEEVKKAVKEKNSALEEAKKADKEKNSALEEAEKARKEKNSALEEAEKARKEKGLAIEEAILKEKDAIEAKIIAEKQVEEAIKHVEIAEQKLKDLELQTKYAEEFYDILDKMHSGIFNTHKKSKQVCDSLCLDIDKKNPTEVLKDEFKNADLPRKEMIIKVMKSVISESELQKLQDSRTEADSSKGVSNEELQSQDEQTTQQSVVENH